MTEPSENGVLRSLRPADVPAACELSAHAGWNQTEDDWRMLLALATDGCMAIEIDGVLAATTTLLCYGRQLAWIGMVLTKAEFQRRGLANRLFREALARADKMGIATVKLDATDQGQPLYEKFGFRGERVIERWSRPGTDASQRPSAQAPPESWNGTSFDAFEVDRSALLDHLARRRAPLVIDRSYLFSRPGRFSEYLGPCVSGDPLVARDLINRCIENTSCTWAWDLFPSNRDASSIARDLGFTTKRRLLRMSRGKELRRNDDAIYAIAGFELG
jgi:ribosomal protein S18 acetylase RimI-like enzyme